MATIATLEGLRGVLGTYSDVGGMAASVPMQPEIDRSPRGPIGSVRKTEVKKIVEQDSAAIRQNRRVICEATTQLNEAMRKIEALDKQIATAKSPQREALIAKRGVIAVMAVRQAHVRADAALLANQHKRRAVAAKVGDPSLVEKISLEIQQQKQATAAKQANWQTDNACMKQEAASAQVQQINTDEAMRAAKTAVDKAIIAKEVAKPPATRNTAAIREAQNRIRTRAAITAQNVRKAVQIKKAVAIAPKKIGAYAIPFGRRRVSSARPTTAGQIRAAKPRISFGALDGIDYLAGWWDEAKDAVKGAASQVQEVTSVAAGAGKVAGSVNATVSSITGTAKQRNASSGNAFARWLGGKAGAAAAKARQAAVATALPGGWTVGKVALAGGAVLGLGYFLFLRKR